MGFNMIALLVLCFGSAVVDSSSRIVGGSSTNIHFHPHQVSLVATQDGNEWHSCGGVIIAPNWVLTAAHCVEYGGNYHIQTNDGNLNNVRGIHNVAMTIMHPSYNTGCGALANDLALLKVYGDLTASGMHYPIPMADSVGEDFSELECTITGWGSTGADGGTSDTPDQLQETTGWILNSFQCSQLWGDNYMHNKHICIDNWTTGMCLGDSGGPMVCNGVLAGIASFMALDCVVYFPSVYARVSNYNAWIVDTMNDN